MEYISDYCRDQPSEGKRNLWLHEASQVVLLYFTLKGTLKQPSRAVVQVFPTSAKIIYDAIVADSAIMAKVGTYTFREGTTNDAISIVSPGQDLPALRNVSGVEIVLHDTGESETKDYLTDPSYVMIRFAVFVIAWESADGADVQEIVNLILKKFQGSRTDYIAATSDGLGSLVQSKIIIRSEMPFNAAS